MVNTKRDAGSYESPSYEHAILVYDGDALYEGFLQAKKNSDWKPEVQRFEMNLLTELASLQEELINETFELRPTKEFKINERGHTRIITGDHIRDRTVKHALCDNILNPAIQPHLIYDNGASIKGKGISFTRDRLVTHLKRYYRENKTNEGYILLIDYSKYYDNIRHKDLLEIFKKYTQDEKALWLIEKILDSASVDVSYMTDEEYNRCMGELFNSIEYFQLDKSKLTKEKFMPKHLNIGDQVSQTAGTAYPMEIDNYIKIVKGIKYYGRYMDDSYIISRDKEELKKLLVEINGKAKELGIFMNLKKTRICKLNDYWRFLQIQYCLTSTGRVIQKIHPKRLTHIRRQMKKMVNIIGKEEYLHWFKSWYRGYYKFMSRKQRKNITKLLCRLLSLKGKSAREVLSWLKVKGDNVV